LRDGSLREGSVVETTGDLATTVGATLPLDHRRPCILLSARHVRPARPL
jgi:hypothetical protein